MYIKRCRQKNRGLIIAVCLMLNEFQVLLIYYLKFKIRIKKYEAYSSESQRFWLSVNFILAMQSVPIHDPRISKYFKFIFSFSFLKFYLP